MARVFGSNNTDSTADAPAEAGVAPPADGSPSGEAQASSKPNEGAPAPEVETVATGEGTLDAAPVASDIGSAASLSEQIDTTAETPQEAKVAEAKEADPEQPEAQAGLPGDVDGMHEDDLPNGAVIVGDTIIPSVAAHAPIKQAAAFDDEHVGKGGSYVLGDDGVRRPAYERYQLPDTSEGAAPGAMVPRVRRVM